MTTKELEGIYATACQAKGFEPNDGQFRIWRQTLGWVDRADLEQALIWYFSENTNFPMPSELKTLAGRAQQARVARTSEARFLVVWLCPVCGFRQSGFLAQNADARRYCPSHWGPLLPIDAPRVEGKRPERIQLTKGTICGHDLQVVTDERNSVPPEGEIS
jgi:hypothetical protein